LFSSIVDFLISLFYHFQPTLSTPGELAQTPPDILQRRLGVNGLLLRKYANGEDDEPVMETGVRPAPKSIGNSTTAPRDLETPEEVRVTTMLLSESVAERLRDKEYKCRVVQVSLRFASLFVIERQEILPFPTCTAQGIGDAATRLILDNWKGMPLPSIGVRACKLVPNGYMQLSLMPEIQADQRQEDKERAVQDIRRRFGHFSILRGNMVAEPQLSDLDTRDGASAQSVAFYHGG
jgi:DNA polymerase-4